MVFKKDICMYYIYVYIDTCIYVISTHIDICLINISYVSVFATVLAAHESAGGMGRWAEPHVGGGLLPQHQHGGAPTST